MSYYTVQDTSLKAIGDAIRSKGVPRETRTVIKFEVPSSTYTWSGTGYSTNRYLNISEEELLSVCNNVRPTYLQVDVTLPGAQNESLYVYYQLSGWSADNHVITLPTTGNIICCYEWYHQSYSTQYYRQTIPEATFTFLDANHQPIIAKEGVTRIDIESAGTPGFAYKNLLSSTVVLPSTLSIDDMIELITDDLTKASN